MTVPTTPRPVVFLDIDGPVNAYAAKPSRNWRHRYVYLDDANIAHRFVDRDEAVRDRRRRRLYEAGRIVDRPVGRVVPFVLDPDLPGRLTALTEVADIEWATSWDDQANVLVSPLLNLPTDLPVVECSRHWARSLPTEPFYKTRLVAAASAGRRGVWFDDEVSSVDATVLAELTGHRVLAIRVEPGRGITDRHVATALRHLTRKD